MTNLTDLKINIHDNTPAILPPPNLQKLTLSYLYTTHSAEAVFEKPFPSTLQHMEIVRLKLDNNFFKILPPNLSILYLDACELADDTTPIFPSKLQFLSVGRLPLSLEKLPPLRSLTCTAEKHSLESINSLPTTLVDVTFLDSQIFDTLDFALKRADQMRTIHSSNVVSYFGTITLKTFTDRYGTIKGKEKIGKFLQKIQPDPAAALQSVLVQESQERERRYAAAREADKRRWHP
eukprot:Phypoly_transcript_16668.p1 GENE.Phypoly_transcript_16668~~Phypoly_transcript_16668.p1  ORF type:complete len:273 (+),score=47.30 Phypoly_transcript_16668:117-821(+)